MRRHLHRIGPIMLVLPLWPTVAQERPDWSRGWWNQPAATLPHESAVERVLEIRSYNLKPGTRDGFHRLFVTQALPLLERSKIDVVAYGPSLHDADSWYLMRAFGTVEERERSEDAFYGSREWRDGPREAILAGIESYATVVIPVDEVTLRGLRQSKGVEMKGGATSPAGPDRDLELLVSLNRDYVRAVERSDAGRFEEILAPDFLCSNPDGSIVDRRAFLQQIARPSTITDLRAEDVQIRLLGDVAIVHGRTSFTRIDGRAGSGRYTDVWARRDGRWLAVAAHVTRLTS
jgi:ketosteroid isomerase-like protein